ncbi:hypothetical protein E2C01_099086 [Portunus trituberculatus]|uniref:Uncharacterized protein n=1 Tax=Portunus trituberculatus TaxID=210409 RepID=A0A5B7KA29_PORTR|nr:hypothetical protein [Portunus trituberculatus]
MARLDYSDSRRAVNEPHHRLLAFDAANLITPLPLTTSPPNTSPLTIASFTTSFTASGDCVPCDTRQVHKDLEFHVLRFDLVPFFLYNMGFLGGFYGLV